MEQVFENSAYSAVDGRFEFGKNWTRFLSRIDGARIEAARTSIAGKLGTGRSGRVELYRRRLRQRAVFVGGPAVRRPGAFV